MSRDARILVDALGWDVPPDPASRWDHEVSHEPDLDGPLWQTAHPGVPVPTEAWAYLHLVTELVNQLPWEDVEIKEALHSAASLRDLMRVNELLVARVARNHVMKEGSC